MSSDLKAYDEVVRQIVEEDIDLLFDRAQQRVMELYPDHTFVDPEDGRVMSYLGIHWKTMDDVLKEDKGWEEARMKFLWHDEYTAVMDFFAVPNDVYDKAVAKSGAELKKEVYLILE